MKIKSSSRDNAGQVLNDGDGGNPMRFGFQVIHCIYTCIACFMVCMLAFMQYRLADAQLSPASLSFDRATLNGFAFRIMQPVYITINTRRPVCLHSVPG